MNFKQTGKLLKVSIESLKLQMHNEVCISVIYYCHTINHSYLKKKERSKTSLVSDEEFERRLRELEKMEYKVGADVDGKENDSNNLNDSWMELYRPKNYLDLLSEETVNRTLLHWLKLWDKAVFNREVKIKPPKIEEVVKAKWGAVPGRFDNNKKFDKFKKKNNDGELKEELDNSGRPLQKIVLISGPPGLGKTTLAHVVAKHAGDYLQHWLFF